jgi:hypothetical protein
MSARSFRSVFMVASCAGAALGCYLVSLNVASERASLENVENRIVLAQRDIRLLQTEIGTRGRLAQLERWNVKVLALSAPSADQFLEGGFQLARLARPEPTHNVEAPVLMASVPAPSPQSAPLEEGEPRADGAGASVPAAQMMHEASLKIPVRDVIVEPAERPQQRKPVQTASKSFIYSLASPAKEPEAKAAGATSEAHVKAPQPKPSVNEKKAGDKKVEAAAKPVTKPVRLAKVDPLAPLPAKANSKKTAKDSGSAR